MAEDGGFVIDEDNMTILERYNAIQKIGAEVTVPHEVWTCFGEKQKTISIAGTDISLGEDFTSLERVRTAIEFYVKQFGGSVKWSK